MSNLDSALGCRVRRSWLDVGPIGDVGHDFVGWGLVVAFAPSALMRLGRLCGTHTGGIYSQSKAPASILGRNVLDVRHEEGSRGGFFDGAFVTGVDAAGCGDGIASAQAAFAPPRLATPFSPQPASASARCVLEEGSSTALS